MIIDADVHLSPLREYETNMNAEMLMESMEEAGVDKALCWVHRPYIRSILPEVQRYLYESSKRYPGKILGFGWVRTMPGMSFTGACMSMDFMVSNLMGHRMNI